LSGQGQATACKLLLPSLPAGPLRCLSECCLLMWQVMVVSRPSLYITELF
jgi:hypothetical protein